MMRPSANMPSGRHVRRKCSNPRSSQGVHITLRCRLVFGVFTLLQDESSSLLLFLSPLAEASYLGDVAAVAHVAPLPAPVPARVEKEPAAVLAAALPHPVELIRS